MSKVLLHQLLMALLSFLYLLLECLSVLDDSTRTALANYLFLVTAPVFALQSRDGLHVEVSLAGHLRALSLRILTIDRLSGIGVASKVFG